MKKETKPFCVADLIFDTTHGFQFCDAIAKQMRQDFSLDIKFEKLPESQEENPDGTLLKFVYEDHKPNSQEIHNSRASG